MAAGIHETVTGASRVTAFIHSGSPCVLNVHVEPPGGCTIAYYDQMQLFCSCADPEGGGAGGPDPLENYKNIGFLSKTGPNPLKITKLPS